MWRSLCRSSMGTTVWAKPTRLLFVILIAAGPLLAESFPDIEYSRAGGEILLLDAEVPQGPGPFPAAILVHGGGFEAGDKRTYIKYIFEPLSEGGFVWFSINYRLSPKHRFPAATDDVAEAVRFVRRNASKFKVDVSRIALIGESAGGHLVSYVGVRRPPGAEVAAVVSFYGIHDFVAFSAHYRGDSEVTERFLGVRRLTAATTGALIAASPIEFADKRSAPFLMIHGVEDEGVPFEQSTAMCASLTGEGVPCSVISVQGGHGMNTWEPNPELHHYKQEMIDWLWRTLP